MLISSIMGDGAQGTTAIEWPAVLPEEISGWRKTEDKIFDRETLYSHIDGGAELYLSYGFRSLFYRSYECAGQPELIVEVFDMASSANAFGIFAHSRESIDSTFGQGSQYIEGMLLFWKDHYLISLLASPDTPFSRGVLYELAGKIDRAIPQKGALPEILKLLPGEGLIPSSIRYFHHYIWLNTYYYIADQNILHIDQNCEAVLAQYEQGTDNPLLLLVVRYADQTTAGLAEHDFKNAFLPDAAGKSIVQIEDKFWTGYKLDRQVLIVLFRGAGRDNVEKMCRQVESKLTGLQR